MTYSETYFRARESWRDWRIEARELMSASHLTAGAHVLEVGCGGGGLLTLLATRGARVTGVDTHMTPLKMAARRRVSSVVCLDRTDTLPFRSGAFDAVIGQHVLEHITNLELALSEWQRVLKQGGRVALATPNRQYPDAAHFADGDHVHVYSADELRTIVTTAGFTVESCSTLFPYLSRVQPLRLASVLGYQVFRKLPYFSSHGRTILLSACRA